jgi:cytochrome c-type biogenesis protein CcsB
MNYFYVENFLANFSFLVLLISMIFYWLETSFRWKKWNFGLFMIILGNLSLFVLLLLRWNESGHFPLSNLYESLLFLSWCCTTVQVGIETFTNQKFLGCLTAPTALLTNAFASFSLPLQMQQSSPLVPALQSNWLMMHVTVMILSYAALICGSLLSIAFLVVTRNLDETTLFSSNLISSSNARFSSSFQMNQNESTSLIFEQQKLEISNDSNPRTIQKLGFAQTLDNLSYRILGIGFPFLTIGILSGAVWANEAWGSYWSWDPKETWAFLTWLVFAIYLHTRFTKGWQGKKPALIASFGFLVVWMCFLGVNLLGKGLHSYGWIQT